MPAIMRKNVAAGTANDLQGLKFEEIPPQGALITLYATTAAAGGNIDMSVEGGTRDVLDSAGVNIESSADVVDTDRDVVLDREPVGGGKMFLAVNAQICNYLLDITYLPAGR